MLVYRICHKRYSTSLHASGIEGRWNSDGKKVIYAAESIPLAFMENMIRRQGLGFNNDFDIMFIEIPDVKFTEPDVSKFPADWRTTYGACQAIGDQWYDDGKTLILKIPSAVLTINFNYLINTVHPEFKKVKHINTTPLVPDERIEAIIKGYGKSK